MTELADERCLNTRNKSRLVVKCFRQLRRNDDKEEEEEDDDEDKTKYKSHCVVES